ncbi:PA domain-containing protein [Thalassobellus sediminis]|uniref:PA domain-containing protein n=1 Tax=Thalassobellus sediminis TaxID=3367753 RepID=UPI00378733D2
MRKILFSFLGVLFVLTIVLFLSRSEESNNIAELRIQHQEFLKNSPFKETLMLSKKERKAKRLPPNKYSERMWDLTMNPAIGAPEPEKLFQLQEKLKEQASFSKVPGEKLNNWEERGPDNVGGRTRAIMFDPNDATNKRVFAGGVSGGLWVNNDITSSLSPWSEVDIPNNLAISCITYDPNNPMVFYVGTGESYVQGSVNGNGVWKSTNGGTSWSKVFGGPNGNTAVIPGSFNPSSARVAVNSPSGIAGDYFGIRAAFGESLTPISGSLVLADDGTAAPNEACNAFVNAGAINGNIAILYRGTCDFSQKVLNAQNAGAVAVIVVNNVAGGPSIMSAGAQGDSVTIPSLMLSMEDGQTIIDQLGSGVNVSINGYANYSGYTARSGVQHINDVIVRDIGGGNSEVYVAAGSSFYGKASPSVLLGPEEFGLYKSTNSGSNWSKIPLLSSSNSNDYQLQPNDIEISADNTVWVAATTDVFTDGGGEILSSSDGVNFTLKYKVPSGQRTEIAVSGTNASTLYVLAETLSETAPVKIIHTDDAFATTTNLPLPVDLDTGIDQNDFTNGQGYYNLTIEVDPTNDAIVYAGGIDLFRSSDSGNTWVQIAEYYSSTGLSEVHPDHHAFVFDPSDPTKAVNGNDGGVYYATSLSGTPSITARNKNYNTLQFYHGSIGQEVANVKFLAGAQDNGSQFINNAAAGINESSSPTGGDGTYVFIDKDNQYIITSTQNGNYYYRDYATGVTSGYTIEGTGAGGQFINPADLDSETNYLFSDGTIFEPTTTYQINRYRVLVNRSTSSTISNALLDSSPTAFKSSTNTSQTLFVGTETGKLLKITNANGTETWEDITGGDFLGSISSINLGATDLEIYITFYNYGVTSVFYTSDGGTTWQNKEGDLPDVPVRAILANPLNTSEVIIATDLGVWGTFNFNDISPNWYQSQNGMKDVIVTSFDLRTSDNTVMATTYGRGIFTGEFTADASSLSVNDNTFKDLVKVYPTVSSGKFKISASNEIRNGLLSVFDMNGREVFKSKIDFNKNQTQDISLKASSGLYIVQFNSENKQSTHKIVIE